MARIFISYSRSDKNFVDGFIQELEAAGHDVWVDREGIRGGDQWRLEIVEAIEQNDVFLLMLSKNSLDSDHVRTEVDLAKESRKRIIPVDIEPVVIPSTMKYQLAGVQRINLYADHDFGFQNLLSTLGGISPPNVVGEPAPPPVASKPPSQQLSGTGNRWLIAAGVIALLVVFFAVAYLLRGGGSQTPPAGPPESSQDSSAQSNSAGELEPLLLEANVPLALPEDLERTRGYFTGPDSAYHRLGAAVLAVMGDQRFAQPVYLDIVDKHFTRLAGGDYSEQDSLDLHLVQEALVDAHNDYYGDDASLLSDLLDGSAVAGASANENLPPSPHPVSATEASTAPPTVVVELPAPETLTTLAELEPLLLQANIRLSEPEDEERTRNFFTGPDSAYHMLAVASLTVIGERRFVQPVNLDIVDKWYTQAVGSGYADLGPLNLEIVEESLVDAHNDYWGDNATSLDELLEPLNNN